jgi:predicted nucleic acid-binding protein
VVVVSNSSPLIYVAALGDFDLLPRLFGEIHIPSAVWKEIVEQGAGFPVQAAALQAVTETWLRVTPLRRPVEPIHLQGRRLHLGETEVIRLAEQLPADALLLDDRDAVIHARTQGFRVAPTIAIYIEAKRKGMIGSIKEKVDQLRIAGFRLTERDYKAVLAAAREHS